jgi:hypothetical protein
VIDVGKTPEVLLLPNKIEDLTKFFGGLDTHRFHISHPDYPTRGLSSDDCYQHYDRHPDVMLWASYLGEYNQSSTGSGKRIRITNEERSIDMEWLESEKLRLLHSCVSVSEEEL